MNYFLGIDIAKTNHVASLINNTGDVVIRAIKFTNSIEGFDKLLSTIQDKLGDLSNIEVAAVNTICPQAAPGDAPKAFAIGVAAFNAFASN